MTAAALSPYRVEAFNTAKASENKIHDDDVARRFGFGGGLVPGVDHKTALATDRRPDKIIHRHWPVMRIATDKVIGAPGVALGIADRIELVFGEMAVHGAASALSTRIN